MTYRTIQEKIQSDFQKSLNTNNEGYILPQEESYKNLYHWQDKNSVQSVLDYFKEHSIKWWECKYDKSNGKEITCHMLSSQIACVNHLFFIRHDSEAVLAMINGIPDLPAHFKNVLNIPCDKGTDNFISFEMVASKDRLHEGHNLKRGEYCTSVDAFIYAIDDNEERWLLPIEWKYTETYHRDDKSAGDKGKTRLKRYCNIDGDNLIGNSKQLCSLNDYYGSIYFQEPFYQLMRQTLWAETICKSSDEKLIPAQHFLHIHVCPKANIELLNKTYTDITDCPTMENAWRKMLQNQDLYHLIDPKELLNPIKNSYPDLYNYLNTRYWQ